MNSVQFGQELSAPQSVSELKKHIQNIMTDFSEVNELDVELPDDFTPDETCDRLPTRSEKEKAYEELVYDPDQHLDEPFEEDMRGEIETDEEEGVVTIKVEEPSESDEDDPEIDTLPIRKTCFLTRVIQQNQYASRLAFRSGMSTDWLFVVKMRGKLQEGKLPNKEKLNEIAYRHTLLNPNTQTREEFF